MSDSNSGSFSSEDPQNSRRRLEVVKKISRRKRIGHLPSELLKFVKNESYSLLVKGKPGTGKTTFALTLLDNLDDDSNYFYISTRLSLKQLSFYFPWVEKFFSRDENKSGYRFEDARLDEPESLFERITNQLMDVKSPVIFIDTWDTIASFMDRESRLNNERVLQIWRERAGAKLIFLSEAFDLGILDSIVDGVITFENHLVESTNSRKLTINKLRGIPIHCNTYKYTLYEGVFRFADNMMNLNLFESLDKTQSNSKKINRELKNTFKKVQSGDNYQSPEMIIANNKLVNIIVDQDIDHELFLSVLLKPLQNWLKTSSNLMMINNFNACFRNSCEKILGFHLSSDVLKSKIINQEINFTEPFGIRRDNQKELSFVEYANGAKMVSRNDSKEFPLLTRDPSNMDESNEKGDDSKILNLINSYKLQSLLIDESFCNLLLENFAVNLVVHEGYPDKDYGNLLRNNPCVEIKLEGRNIIVFHKRKKDVFYLTISDSDGFFVNWFPVL